MQLMEEIRKLCLNRTPLPSAILDRAAFKNTSVAPSHPRLSAAIRAPVTPVSWTREREGGGAWHFWKSEEQPVKASQHLSHRRNWSNGGRRLGRVEFALEYARISISSHSRAAYAAFSSRRHAREGLSLGLGKLKRIAA